MGLVSAARVLLAYSASLVPRVCSFGRFIRNLDYARRRQHGACAFQGSLKASANAWARRSSGRSSQMAAYCDDRVFSCYGEAAITGTSMQGTQIRY
eukprot:4591327-Pleurochrysis_carterae.AAC.1